jgi:double-strand break repair protein MRE11
MWSNTTGGELGKVVSDTPYSWQTYSDRHPLEKNVNGSIVDSTVVADLTVDNIKVEKLVREFLEKQNLTVLPQNSFGDAVRQFVDKDEKHAVEVFVNDSLSAQLKHLMSNEDTNDEDVQEAMEAHRAKLEELFASGHVKRKRTMKIKPKPDHWNSDLDGEWAEQPGAWVHSDIENDNVDGSVSGEVPASPPPTKTTARGGRGRGRGGTTRAAARTTTTKAPAKSSSFAPKRSKPSQSVVSDDEESSDIVMLDDEDEEESEPEEAPAPASRTRTSRKVAAPAPAPKAKTRAAATLATAPAKKPIGRQAKLSFSQQTKTSATSSTASVNGSSARRAPSRTPASSSLVSS